MVRPLWNHWRALGQGSSSDNAWLRLRGPRRWIPDFNETTDFSLNDLEEQIRNSAERLTLFIGGNDLREIYGEIYENNAPGTFVEDFIVV